MPFNMLFEYSTLKLLVNLFLEEFRSIIVTKKITTILDTMDSDQNRQKQTRNKRSKRYLLNT